MKKIAFIAILWLCGLLCVCQSRTIELNIAADTLKLKGNSDTWISHVNSSANQTSALITLADRKRVYYFLINSSFEYLGRYSVDKDDMVANFYGPKYSIVLQTSTDNSFRNYVY